VSRPGPTSGMRHVALFVKHFEQVEDFYTRLMGMREEWRPDPDNVYLTSGNDNLALHRVEASKGSGCLDHIGFFVDSEDAVDAWYEFLTKEGIQMFTAPRTHRDGARSFYCADPEGVRVQIIYHPPIVGK